MLIRLDYSVIKHHVLEEASLKMEKKFVLKT